MQTSNISYGSSVSKPHTPSIKETVYYSKHKTYKSETLHIILNMSKHHNRIVELKLRLLEEPGEKTFVVPHVDAPDPKVITNSSVSVKVFKINFFLVMLQFA